MAEMISVREAAVRWNITERRVATLCKNGRIAGAKKQGNRWLIPADTQKPADQRLKTGAFRKTERAPKLPLPISVSNYCLASSEYYYIDKTMMLKDFIDERPMVTLFTRPRRFGKTLNMDMLRETLPDDLPVVFISSVTGLGIQELKDTLWQELNSESNKLQNITAEDTLVHRDKDMTRFMAEMKAEGEDDIIYIDDDDIEDVDDVEDLDDFEYEEEADNE